MTFLGLLASFTAAGPASATPKKGEPAITVQTQRSGGPINPYQAKLAFDHADLGFEIFPDKEAISGDATLNFTAKAPLDRLVIDLDRNLPPTAISINGTALAKAAWSNPEGQLRITLPKPVAAGDKITARIRYAGTPHVAVRAPWDDGMVWAKTPGGKPWIATTAQGFGCDLFWPCLDFPTGEPARADIRITVPKGLSAPSNGVLIGVDRLSGGRSTWHWRIKHPNTYGIALNIGPYEVVQGSYKSRFGNVIPMYYWYLPGEKAKAEALFAEFAPTLDFFETMIGPYPFGDEKLGVVETPHLGMEHQTINAYGNGYAKAPEGFDWLFQHEFSHEWFGNQLTAANWDDFWLHEGFGQYMQPLYGRWREGDARYATMLDAQRNKIENKVPLISGTERIADDVYQTERGGPGGDIYYKGAWMLHSLRWLIGDAAFFEATRRLVYGRNDPKPGNFAPRFGSSTEFESLVNDITGKDYDWFFDVYLRRAALPELVTARTDTTLALRWKVPGDVIFPMPVEVQVGDDIRRVEMTAGAGTLEVAATTHIVIDPSARILKRSLAVEQFQAYQLRRQQGAK
ncbi:MAG: M1 family metallopeptidase [Sphingomonas sp.]